MGEINSREIKFLKSVKIEDVSRVTCVDYNPFYSVINHPYGDHHGIVIVWVEVFNLFFFEGYFGVIF